MNSKEIPKLGFKMLNSGASRCPKKSPGSEEIDAWTFIRTVDKDDPITSTKSSKDFEEISALQKRITEEVNLKNLKKPLLAINPSTPPTYVENNECACTISRKRSEESLASKILKPSLRMKAYKNHRQDTFHSLDMHVDRTQETPCTCFTRLESLPDSVDNVHKMKDDLLQMPGIESMRISTATTSPKCCTKNISESNICSSSKIISKKLENIIDDAKFSSKNPSKKRVLHTFIQPDGCIVGYVEEVDLEEDAENIHEEDNSRKDSLEKKIL